MTDNEFIETYELIIRNLTILNHTIIPQKFYKTALELCNSVDVDDTAFVAITYFIKGKLWTGDKKLIKGLKVSARLTPSLASQPGVLLL